MNTHHTTLASFLVETSQGLFPESQLATLLLSIADTVKSISKLTEKGALADMYGKLESQNIQGETQNEAGCGEQSDFYRPRTSNPFGGGFSLGTDGQTGTHCG